MTSVPVEPSVSGLRNVYALDCATAPLVGALAVIPDTSCVNLFAIVWMNDKIWVNWLCISWISASRPALEFKAGAGFGIAATVFATVTYNVLQPPDAAHTAIDAEPGLTP